MLHSHGAPEFPAPSSCFEDLGGFDDLAGKRVLILGPDIGIMCELIQRDCRHVTELDPHGCSRAGTVDLVIVSSVGTSSAAAYAIDHARRALTLAGRIVVRTAGDPSEWLSRAIKRTLRLHGFSAIATHQALGRAVFTAELNFLGSSVRA